MAAALIGPRNHPESLILESLVETATAAVAIKNGYLRCNATSNAGNTCARGKHKNYSVQYPIKGYPENSSGFRLTVM